MILAAPALRENSSVRGREGSKERPMISSRKIFLVLAVSLLLAACKDSGTEPETPPVQPPVTGPQDTLRFSTNILPIFQQRGCTGCHGGSGGLFVGTVAQLLQGGQHGPAIIPGNGAGSNLVKKISPNPPFGERMPQGGPYLPDSTIQVIKTWIDQGARP
jgi:hypothetical protein